MLEIAGGDAVGGPLQAADAAREGAGGPPADEDREAEGDEASPDEPGADDVDVLERRPQRRRVQEDVPVLVRKRHLGERLVLAADDAPGERARRRRLERDRVVGDVLGETRATRVGGDEEGGGTARRRGGEDDGPVGVGGPRRVVDEILVGLDRLGALDLTRGLG